MSTTPSDTTPSNISHEALVKRLGDPALKIVDVLPRDSYVQAHIPGAVNLPVADIRNQATILLPNLHDNIVLYCASPS